MQQRGSQIRSVEHLWNNIKHKGWIVWAEKAAPLETAVDGIVVELKIPTVVSSLMKKWFEWKCRWNGKGGC